MTPDFRVTLNNQEDITPLIRQLLASLSVTDTSDAQSDRCTVSFADPKGQLALPEKGHIIRVEMGYKESSLHSLGSFFVTESDVSGAPDVVTLQADGANFLSTLKNPKQKNWSGRTLGAVVENIAMTAGYQAAVQPEVASYFFDRLYQDNETDHQFLRRVAGSIGAVYKPNGDRLAIVRHDSQVSASGLPLTPVTLTLTQLTDWSYSQPEQAVYNVVRVWWHDQHTNDYKSACVTRNEDPNKAPTVELFSEPTGTVYTLRTYYDSQERAISEAKSMLQRLQKTQEKMTITTVGNPSLLCEMPVTITGGRPELNRDWIVMEAEHRLSAEGYITSAVLTPSVAY